MTELKTKPQDWDVDEFIAKVTPDQKRQDCEKLLAFFKKETKANPVIWGKDMIGFGTYHYKGKSGQEGDWFVTGFSPKKANITLYMTCYLENMEEFTEKLGKFKHGKSCIYIKNLEDIDLTVLKKLVSASIKQAKKIEAESR